jgi:hypothetical protein
LVHNQPEQDDMAAGRAANRIKVGTRRWAKRHGYARNMRRKNGGREIWVRFTVK